jgi:uncharacterized damage-inducible protein DinB
MTPESRAELLLAYARGPRLLREALAAYPPEALDFKPGEGKWSIRQIVLHLAESELQGYLRGRTIIAEPGNPVLAYDQDRWAATLDGADQPLEEALDLFRLLREMMARQLRALPEEAWGRTMLHPQRGPVTLEKWLEIYENHLRVHLDQAARTFAAFPRG